MGVDSEAILIYGWSFGYEEFRELIIPFMEKNAVDVSKYSDPDEGEGCWLFLELCDEFEGLVREKYPTMTTGRAASYYDCYPNEYTFYITISDVTDLENTVIQIDWEDYPLVNDLGLKDPKIEAIVNVY